MLDNEIEMLQVHQQGASLVLGCKAGTRRKPGLGRLHQRKTKHGAITLDLSTAGRSCGREKQEDDQGRQADRKTDRKGGPVREGGTTGRGRPQQAR